MITAVKLSAYINSVGPIRSWYQGQHRNLFELNGEESKWKVWNGALQETKVIIKKIQTYLERTAQGKIFVKCCIFVPYEIFLKLVVSSKPSGSLELFMRLLGLSCTEKSIQEFWF